MLPENENLTGGVSNRNEVKTEDASWSKGLKYWASIFNRKSELNQISTSKYFTIKLIWFVCLAISILVCAVLIAKTIAKYYKYEVSTKIRDIYPERIKFPVITICNNNPMVTPEANEFIRKYYLDEYKVNISTSDEFFELIKASIIEDENSFIQYMINDPSFNATLRDSFGYDYINGVLIDDVIDNFYDYVQIYHSTVFGKCWRFNSKSNNNSRFIVADGKTNGFLVEIFLGSAETITKNIDSRQFNGLHISIDEQDKESVFFNFITGVNPGRIAVVTLSKTQATKMPHPYSNCIPVEIIDTLLSREMRRLNISYTRANCLFMCEQKQNIDQLGCYNMYLPPMFDALPCNNKSIFYHLVSSMTYNTSECDCPQECRTTQYNAIASYFDAPSYQQYKRMLVNDEEQLRELFKTDNITYEMVQKSFSSILFKFNEIKITEMEESEAMTFYDLLGDIGGIMGLFIGFSFMAFVNFVELVVKVTIVFCSTYSNRSKK